jgi:serine/threonine protein kinase
LCLRNRYLLESLIGQGAMGQVWKAKDLLGEEARDRNPFVAIKLMQGDFERHPQSFAALHREASRTQKLAHPNIVTVYTLDRDERTGRVFMAMELLDGEPLDQLIRRSPLRDSSNPSMRPQQLWPIIKGLAEGLAYAHRKNLVHSDFKPGNVFLTREGVPKVLDFGIARAVKQGEDAAGADASSDRDSVFSGYTESYASPEQIAGQPPHTADDVFALGMVAYELLTGRHPFGRKPASEASAANLVPEPIGGITRRQWRIIQKALAFRRADRWPHADAFLEALQKRTALQITLAATVAVLLVTASGLTYKNHLDRLPAVPFEQLPQQQREQVQQALADGNEALRLVRDSHLIEASADAADRFAAAYAIHPRNPQAVAGLEQAAAYFIDYWDTQNNQEGHDRERALQELKKFQEKSDYYRGYGPLTRALQKTEKAQ